ncbi:hypothetical protein [Hymenobacter montanus]|uniref:hypothetical protein n=1 Tax=Hymenobacter montanus TaxID=2771359 RepID=UPI00168BAD7B|nr:hypothetical protein [Hymenobacter montanus]
MMFAILFLLLALFLAGYRDGVWTKYTPQDVARWQVEAAAQSPNIHQSPTANHAAQLPSNPVAPPVGVALETEGKPLTRVELEAA